MALVHVFNGLNKKTTYEITGKLCNNLRCVDWEHSIILRGGYRVNKDYEVKPDDVLYIRATPSGATTAVVIGVIALVGAGVAAGVSMYNNKKALSAVENAQKAAKANSDNTNKLPYIKGARNSAATGQTFPFAIGQSLMTPYRLCPAHYTIAGERGEEQYYNTVLEVAYNDIVINKIKLGETVIKDFSNEVIPQNGQYNFDAGVYYDDRNLIEIRQTGAFDEDDFNNKIVMTELNTEIPHDHATSDPVENERIEKQWRAGIVQQLATHAKAVEIIVLFDGLQLYKDGWKPHTITLRPQWTNVNNPEESDWVDFDNGFNQNGVYSNTFTYNTKTQMRYSAKQDFTPEEALNKSIKVRVVRTTPKTTESAKENVYVVAVQTTCYDALKSNANELITAQVLEPNERDKCCRLGVKIAANVNTEGMLDAISVIETACARTWNGTSWSETKTPTRNLAAWALELLTSPHHKPSQYNDEELDLASFGAWYEYCEQEGFYADGIISKGEKKKNVLDKLCNNSNAVLFVNRLTGKIEVAIDNGREYSVALLNSDNIISISTTKEFKRKSDGKKVTYVNAAADYDVDSVIFMRDGEAYEPATDTLTESALEYVTTYQHAYKIAWRQMAEELAQPRIVTVKTGLESAYYPLYSRVELQHKSLKIGLNHGIIKAVKWQGGLLKEIELEGSVKFPESGACGVIVNCVSDTGRGILPLKVDGSGKTNILYVLTQLNINADVIPSAGNSLSFGLLDVNGEFTSVTKSMKITNAEESDAGFTLTLVDYNPALYEYGILPEYKSNITSIPDGKKQTVEEQREYIQAAEAESVAKEAAGQTVGGAVQAAVDQITHGTTFTNIYNVRADGLTLEDIIAKMDDDARNASASISISEDEILLQVQDMERELVGLIDIQAGAVTALVEGGGAQGQLSLSLELPVVISPEMFDKFVTISTQKKVAAVYGKVTGTNYYGIKASASNADVKRLWDDAVKAKMLASQIVLEADQIAIKGDVIVNEENKIKASLLEVENILAKRIEVKEKGVLLSSNYNGVITENGTIDPNHYGTIGWAMDHVGNADFVNLNATGGIFDEILVKKANLQNTLLRLSQTITIQMYNTWTTEHILNYLEEKRSQIYNVFGDFNAWVNGQVSWNISSVHSGNEITIESFPSSAMLIKVSENELSIQTDKTLAFNNKAEFKNAIKDTGFKLIYNKTTNYWIVQTTGGNYIINLPDDYEQGYFTEYKIYLNFRF